MTGLEALIFYNIASDGSLDGLLRSLNELLKNGKSAINPKITLPTPTEIEGRRAALDQLQKAYQSLRLVYDPHTSGDNCIIARHYNSLELYVHQLQEQKETIVRLEAQAQASLVSPSQPQVWLG
jgi:hypothetical protein